MENNEKRLYVIIVHGKEVESFTNYGQAIACYEFICKLSEQHISAQKTILKQYSFNNEMTLEEHKNYHSNDNYNGNDSSLQVSRLWDMETNKFTYIHHTLPIKRVTLYTEKVGLKTKLDKDNDFEIRECWYINLYGIVTYYPFNKYCITSILSTDRQTTLSCLSS